MARRVHLVLSTEAVAFVAAAGVHLSLSTQAAHVATAFGLGPRTLPDVLFHLGMLTLLVFGLLLTTRPG